MAKRDYYEVLGLAKNATADEIKKAYRKLAIQYHPDKNPGDKASEEKFKEAAEAYEILSNPEKKSKYDQFGHAGPASGGFGGGMNMEDIFEQFGDIFGGGGFGGFGRSSSGGKRVNRGTDLRIKIKLTLEEIAEGVTKKIKVNKYVSCDSCSGSGAKSGSGKKTCATCNGSGQVSQVTNTFLGQMRTTSVCPSCSGNGSVISEKCGKCAGDGIVRGEEVIEVRIPAGVEEGMQLSMRGKGNMGPRNGVPGDLLIVIEEEEHPLFKREHQHLFLDLYVNFADAALGTQIEVETLQGKVKIKIEAGTQSGKLLRLRGKGLPNIQDSSMGDLLINVNVWTPQKLDSAETELLQKLRNSENFQPNPGKKDKSFFDKMKEFF
jgi:molecular chaperone DnaJ